MAGSERSLRKRGDVDGSPGGGDVPSGDGGGGDHGGRGVVGEGGGGVGGGVGQGGGVVGRVADGGRRGHETSAGNGQDGEEGDDDALQEGLVERGSRSFAKGGTGFLGFRGKNVSIGDRGQFLWNVAFLKISVTCRTKNFVISVLTANNDGSAVFLRFSVKLVILSAYLHVCWRVVVSTQLSTTQYDRPRFAPPYIPPRNPAEQFRGRPRP